MTEHTRRTVLKVAGTSTLAVAAAGCLGDDDDDDDNGGGDSSGHEIDSGDTIVVDGYASHWEGVEPSAIESENNPTLVLTEGEEYTMEWINADGMLHDLQIQDENDDVVADLISDETDEEDERIELSFTAEPEMAKYVCSYHASNQVGDLVVE